MCKKITLKGALKEIKKKHNASACVDFCVNYAKFDRDPFNVCQMYRRCSSCDWY